MKNKKISIINSNKAALDQIFATVLFIAAFSIIVAIFLYSNNLTSPIKQEISSLHIKLNDEENFVNLMSSYIDDTHSQTMADLLVESIVINNFSKFDERISAKLERDYSKDIYWEYEVIKINGIEKFDTNFGELVYAYGNLNYQAPKRSPDELEAKARNTDFYGEGPMYMQLPLIKNDYNFYMVFRFDSLNFGGKK